MDKLKTGELIREARKAKKYTQSELGDLIGVTNKAVSRWENGESFPDIGVLENLAQVLDLKVQDIVTGEVQQEDKNEIDMEEALTELLRQSKIQLREKKKRILGVTAAVLALSCAVFVGIAGLQSPWGIFASSSGIAYYILYGLTLMLILHGWSVQGGEAAQLIRYERGMRIIPFVTLIWAIAMTYVVSVLVINGIMPFGMEPGRVGPFIIFQLTLIFAVNILMMAYELYRWARGSGELNWGYIIQLAAIYLPAMYGDLLHRLDEQKGYLGNLSIRTAIVLSGMCIALLIMRMTKSTGYGHKSS